MQQALSHTPLITSTGNIVSLHKAGRTFFPEPPFRFNSLLLSHFNLHCGEGGNFIKRTLAGGYYSRERIRKTEALSRKNINVFISFAILRS